MEEEKKEEKSFFKAKTLSLISQIVACLWVAFWSGKKLWDGNGSMSDIVFSGFAIAGCFSPVYFNLILDKIKNIKFGE